jgi:hypothetical protein
MIIDRCSISLSVEEEMMYIPSSARVEVERVRAEIRDFEAANYEKKAGRTVCKKCSRPIQLTTLFVSVHDARVKGTCADRKQVIKLMLPYCPQCDRKEVEGKTFKTCTHV